MNGTANASATLFTSGSKTLADKINKFYMFLDPKQLVDYDELDFPQDVVTYDYNLPQAAAFNESIKPYIENLLEKKVEASLESKEIRDLTMGEAK